MMRKVFFLVFMLCTSVVLPVLAQEPTEDPTAEVNSEDCPVLVQNALELTRNSCEQVGDNQVCYGHSELDAAARPGFPEFNFDAPGDVEDVIEMQSLSLSAMDTAREVWGVLLMNVQAQVADDAEQADVTFVVFGDTQLSVPSTLIEGIVNANANLRSNPDTGSEVVGVVASGETITVNGRTEDGTWLRARFINEEGGVQLGWLSSSLIVANQDLNVLDTISPDELDADSPLQYGPMQAFYFQSGVDDSPCEAAPNSGMMIQTPEGAASVTLWIDEVIIELDGTTYLQAEAGGDLTAYSLDGTVSVTADGETRTAVEGSQVSVPLDEDLTVAGVPTEPEAYNLDDLQSLPTDLLPETVAIADPITVQQGVPTAGSWNFVWSETSLTCPDGSVWTFESSGASALTIAPDGAAINYGGGSYIQVSAGTYSRSYVDDEGNLHQQTLTVNGIDRIIGEATVDLAVTPCVLTIPFTMQLVGS
jgi:uncharacterized protein YgiM (DUF1202 family)